MEYSIGEFSRRTGLGIHTLRYYEHEGLLLPARDAVNRRRYSDRDIAWVEFIKRLKDTGMPIREISRYAALRAAGASTLEERTDMLIHHRKALEDQLRQLRAHMAKLDGKIELYRQELKRQAGDAGPSGRCEGGLPG